MPELPAVDIAAAIQLAADLDRPEARGRAYEDLICQLFSVVPGVEITERNALNAFDTEEVDVALWNNRTPDGFYFLPHLILVECKNWSKPVGTEEIAYFADKLRARGCEYGVMVAANGITGVPQDLTAAHFRVARALSEGYRLIIVTTDEILELASTEDLVLLIKRKLCQLTVSGAILLT